MKNHNLQFLIKIKNHALKAIDYIKTIDFKEFMQDTKTLEACVFNISQIGELVNKMDTEILNKYPNINWQGIKGLRNIIIHNYDGIRYEMIWSILTESLPELINNIDLIIKAEESIS